MNERDRYSDHRDAARSRFGGLTAFRLGIVVGEAEENLPPPYASGSRMERSYLAGLKFGREQAAKKRAAGEPL